MVKDTESQTDGLPKGQLFISKTNITYMVILKAARTSTYVLNSFCFFYTR